MWFKRDPKSSLGINVALGVVESAIDIICAYIVGVVMFFGGYLLAGLSKEKFMYFAPVIIVDASVMFCYFSPLLYSAGWLKWDSQHNTFMVFLS